MNRQAAQFQLKPGRTYSGILPSDMTKEQADDAIFDAMVEAHTALNRANRIREIHGITIRARITYDEPGENF